MDGPSSYMLATRKSQYHDSCIPVDKKVPVADPGSKAKEGDYVKCNHVAQDSIWKQAVGSEKRCLKNWETSWGFLAEFDAQIKAGKRGLGNEKEQEELPEKATVFSDNVPNTNSANYGNRVDTTIGSAMARMEYQFYSGGRRKKMGDDMICY